MEPPDEHRNAKRQAVLKTAKIIWGDSVIDCLVVEQSPAGVRVSTSIPMNVPSQVSIRLSGGAVRPAMRRWARGTEIGFEFAGSAGLDAVAAIVALGILVDLRGIALNDIFDRLAAARCFDDAELGAMAKAAQAAMQQLETALRRRAEQGKQ